MQQRQLRLGDVLDDYCPRERRLTNHAVVAMVGDEVRLTRCTTCDAEHEYKHAKIPRQRRRDETPAALYAQVAASGPKRVVHEPAPVDTSDPAPAAPPPLVPAPIEAVGEVLAATAEAHVADAGQDEDPRRLDVEGPVHRPLIRATLPRLEGQAPPVRPGPDFTIRQPAGAGRAGRFRPRHRGGPPFFGNGANGNGPMRAGARPPSGRAPQGNRPPKRRGGRKRSK